jgi:REP element-mobilizing transposase RayT
MSRLRRLVISNRYFFVTCNLRHTRTWLEDRDFEILARVIDARRQAHGFLLTAWVFLPDHWHAVIGLAYPKTISLAMESIRVVRRGKSTQNGRKRVSYGRGDSLIEPCER